MMGYFRAIANFRDEIMNISISQWDVESHRNEVSIQKIER